MTLNERELRLRGALENAYHRGWEDHARIHRSLQPVNDTEARVVAASLRRFDDPTPDPSEEYWIIYAADGNLIEGHRFWSGYQWLGEINQAVRIPDYESARDLAMDLSRKQFGFGSIALGQYKNVLKKDNEMPYRQTRKET